MSALDNRQRWWRAGAVLVVALAALALRAIEPGTLSWLPLRTSCGAATGLPCIFCGTTRALHELLNGEFAQALYLNWLAFPVALLVVLLASKLVAEVALRRRLPLPALKLTPRSLGAGLAALFLLWIVQVVLTLRFHKHELLNPDGPLYALFLK